METLTGHFLKLYLTTKDFALESRSSSKHGCVDLRSVSIKETSAFRSGPWINITNVHHLLASSSIPIGDEVRECFNLLRSEYSIYSFLLRVLSQMAEKLEEQNIALSQIAHLHVFLSDMSTFSEMNDVYGSYFGTGPPARTCVTVDLPAGVNILIDCIAYEDSVNAPRTALHVQSLSYWSPANIGPYSQAIIVRSGCLNTVSDSNNQS